MNQQKTRPAGRGERPVRRRSATAARKPKSRAPEVVYTQAKPFNKEKLILRLATVVAVVLALFLGMSIFFKVENVQVTGTENYTPWDILDASGIQTGENLMTLNRASAGGRILQKLPYVDSVRIDIQLPDTVNIEIVEEDVYYAIEASDSSWWLMDNSGKILDKTNAALAGDHTRIVGVKLESPVAGQKAQAAEKTPETTEAQPQESTDASAEAPETQPPVTVYESQRLEAAITVLGCLESNGVLGGVKELDVSELGNITLQYGKLYLVELGDTSQMAKKISAMWDTIRQHGDSYQSGTLDVSFTFWPDSVGFTPDKTDEE